MSDETAQVLNLHRRFVNPGWADLLTALGLPIAGLRAEGSWLQSENGAGMLDMVAGFGAAVLGHNPPAIISALHAALDLGTPVIAPLGVIPEAGELAERLLAMAGRGLAKAQFGSTGAEAVDTALKLAAAHTGRTRFLRVRGGFHGLSVGATSLAGSGWWRDPFPDIWLPSEEIEAGDLKRLQAILASSEIAALVLEVVPGSDAGDGWTSAALIECGRLCHASGTLLVIDEVQTGLGRTGACFAFHDGGPDFRPDMVILSKALTGGLIPMSVILMSEPVFRATYGQPGRAKVHGSTLAGNRLAMACGLAVLDALDGDGLIGRAQAVGERIRSLCRGLPGHPQVLGRGCLLALELGSTPDEANARCVDLIRSGVLVTGVSHAPRFVRLTPALNIADVDIDLFVDALSAVMS